jgi:NAD(P)-dependent dehydrogenase (short-subunit alcohol dehydrogenase family)
MSMILWCRSIPSSNRFRFTPVVYSPPLPHLDESGACDGQLFIQTGRLDFAVNSAGIDGGDNAMPTVDYSMEILDQMIATNVRGMFLSMKYEIKQMLPFKAGVIINISSGAGLVGVGGYSGYSATKHAEIGMTKSSAIEYAKHGIRINAICPGLVDTPLVANMLKDSKDYADQLIAMHPIGRIAQAKEISDAIVWLCSDRSSYLVGAALPLDGGYTAQLRDGVVPHSFASLIITHRFSYGYERRLT